MRKLLILILSVSVVLSMAMVSIGADQAAAQAPATVFYNLYATDAYVEMADGNSVYAYGFIGGRVPTGATEAAFQYQTSCIPGLADPITGYRACAGSAVGNGVAPAPQGGPRTANDQLLAGNAQYPAPVIYATLGDVVEIRLKNLGVQAQIEAPNDPHSIHLHGLDVDAANDGVPETSLGAVPANLCADGTTEGAAGVGPCDTHGGYAAGAGNVIVYMFTADKPGTAMYHCHQEADIHVNMGMYGALVIYNPGDPAGLTGPGAGMGGELYGFQYDKDYVMLISEFDIRGHADEEGTYDPVALGQTWNPDPYNWALYEPQYWFINGLSFPQTIHADFPSGFTFTDWLATHPGYDTLYSGSVSTPNLVWGTPGEKVLLRVINLGFETHPLHMHGYHGKIIGSDMRGWDWSNSPGKIHPTKPDKTIPPTPFGVGLEKNTLLIGSGETYEWLIDFGQQAFASVYEVGTESRYDPLTGLPVSNTAVANPPIPDFGGIEPPAPDYIAGPSVAGFLNLLYDPLAAYPFNQPGPLDVLAPDPAVPVSQYFPFHNHDDYKATNDGVYPGGMFTMLVPTP